MAKKKNDEKVAMPDPIQVQIDLLTFISKNDMVATANLVNKLNKFFPAPGTLAIKDTLMPNQYSTVNECSIYAAQYLNCITDQDEVLFYQRYYFALANRKADVARVAIGKILSLPAGTFNSSLYLDAVKLAMSFNDMLLVSKLREKI